MRGLKTAFPTLAGNRSLKERLAADILGHSLSHAYIIEGAKGSGKHTLARQIAAALSCEKKDENDLPLPCGLCPSCKKILSGNSPDLIFVQKDPSKTQLGVDIIRAVREDVRLLPNDTDHKVYVIEDAQIMNDQAQNAFLLTLESPPPYVIFLLLCEDSGVLLETVRSRAPRLNMQRLTADEVEKFICSADERARELRKDSPREFADILTVSAGSIGQALELLDDKKREPISARRAIAGEFISALESRSPREGARVISRLPQKRDELLLCLDQIRLALRDLTVAKKSDDGELCFYSSREEAEDAAFAFSTSELLGAFDAVEEAVDMTGANGNVRLILFSLAAKCKLI